MSFFPQLVAGPIERAKNLLPQINSKRSFKYIQGIEGLRLILWGLFKKVVIADNLSLLVNSGYQSYNLLTFIESWLISRSSSGFSNFSLAR